MKITSVDVMIIGKHEVKSMMNPVICRINTDEGIYGYGEGTATFISGSFAVFEMLRDLASQIIGMNPLDTELIWNKLFRHSFWAQGNGAIIMSAISAIDIACWDIKGKFFNVPIYQLLGGKQRDYLHCYISQLHFGIDEKILPQRTAKDYEEISKKAVEMGYDCVKVDLFKFDEQNGNLNEEAMCGHMSKDMMRLLERRLSAIRDGLGSDPELMIEHHARTNTKSVIQFAKMAKNYDVWLLEEPVDPMNPALFCEIAANCDIGLTTGERSYTRYGFMPLLQAQCLEMIQPDLGTCGGFTEGKKIADLADCWDVGVQMHVCSSPISVAASIQLEAALPNFEIHEQHVADLRKSFLELGTHCYVPENGKLKVPDLPGIGQELSDLALSKATIVTVK